MSRRALLCGGRLAAAALLASLPAAVGALAEDAPKAHPPHHAEGRTAIVAFETTPFPYQGALPDQDRPFLDVHEGARLGHTSPRGGVYWQEPTYASKDVLLSIPPGFDPHQPVTLLVFFHGNNVRLERDVWHRQQVVEQVAQSRLNAVLVAPQFAVDALDSSAGSFWRPGVFAAFLAEAAQRVAALAGDRALADKLAAAPILVAAYSGGYNPAAYALDNGGVRGRVCGVILLDALFGESPRFASWITHRGAAFFVSAYSKASEPQNLALENELQKLRQPFRPGLDDHAPIDPTGIAFVPATQATHNDFVTAAWTASPLRSLLSRVPPCRSGSPAASAAKPLQAGAFEFSPPPGPGARGPGGAPASPYGNLQGVQVPQ